MQIPTTPLTRVELDQAKCEDPECTVEGHPILLLPACHRRGNSVAYDKSTGTLLFSCAECGRPTVAVAVAAGAIH